MRIKKRIKENGARIASEKLNYALDVDETLTFHNYFDKSDVKKKRKRKKEKKRLRSRRIERRIIKAV